VRMSEGWAAQPGQGLI